MSPHILIVDQDAQLAELYCQFLHQCGFSAQSASSGLECLSRIREQLPDVLILDHELRWGDAEGVLACLREDGISIPVILTTWQTFGSFKLPSVVLCLRKFISMKLLLDGILFAICRSISPKKIIENDTLTREFSPAPRNRIASFWADNPRSSRISAIGILSNRMFR